MLTIQRRRHIMALSGVLLFTAVAAPVMPVAAQTQRHRTFAQKHPTATGVAAGIGAYALAKKTGKARERAGQRKNFAQKHPVLSGIAAGMVVRHYAKKHR